MSVVIDNNFNRNEKKMKNSRLLLLSLINIVFLTLGQAFYLNAFIGIAFMIFIFSIILSEKQDFIPLMLFYLPWAPIFKFNPESFTFFTIVVPVFLFSLLFNKKIKIRLLPSVILPIIITLLTVSVKIVNGYSISTRYCFFILMLILIPIYMDNYREKINFERCALFLVAGLLSSAFVAEFITPIVPGLMRYVTEVEVWNQDFFRKSGFVTDPNYYSSQILVGIASIIFVINKNKNKIVVSLGMLGIALLIYFGIISVSKMFILCLSFILISWLSSMVIYKSDKNKVLKIAVIVIFVSIVVLSGFFEIQLDNYLGRLSSGTSTSDITSQRSSIWFQYIIEIQSNIELLFFGNGMSSTLVNEVGSHNSLIEFIFKMGILGSSILVFWWRTTFKKKQKIYHKKSNTNYIYILIMGVAIFIPWLSLDILFHDEFFYYPIVYVISLDYLKSRDSIVVLYKENISIKKQYVG